MPAPVRLALLLVCGLQVAPAQSERRPESFQLAIGLQQRGLHEEAASYLVQFLRDEPQHPLVAEACYRLAQSRIELAQNDQAIQSLEQALDRGGKAFKLRPEALYRLGNLLQAKGNHQQALTRFRALVDELGADHYLAAAAHYAEGEARRDLGQDAEAAAAFAAAAELAAAEGAASERQAFRFPALYQFGFAMVRLRRFDAAAVAFEAAQAAAPDQAAKAECLYLSGDARLRLEQYEPARRCFEQSLDIGGEFADDAIYGLGWTALGRGDRSAALAAFERLLREHPRSPFGGNARLERGRCLYQEQQYAAAEQELQPLLRDGQPLQQAARELLGLCALQSGAGQVAVDALQQALAAAADADRPRLSFALGEALANLGRWPEALAAYEAVPDTVDADLRGDARYGACHALHELGRHDQSIAKAQAVLQIEPAHRSRILAQLAIAENWFALRDYANAERSYRMLEQYEQHRAITAWKLAWCRYLQGDKADAAVRFGAIERDDGNAEEAMAMHALALYEAGDRDQALAIADRYRARYQDGRFLDRTERIAARVLRQRGDLGAAQRRLSQAAAIASARDGAEAATDDLAEQADLAYQQGDFQAADALFARLVERSDAVGARALAGRAWCAFELGDDAACLVALTRAKQHPMVGDELPGLLELESALCHRQQQWPQAIAAAETFLQRFGKHDKSPMMRYALGVARARNGDQPGARAVLAALAADRSHAEQDRVLYELAWACRRDGDEAAAIANFEQVAAATEDVELGGEARLFVGTAALAGQQPDLQVARVWLLAVEGSHRKQALYRLGFAEFASATADAARPDQQLLATARDRFAEIARLPGEELVGEALYLGAECCRRLGDPAGAVQRAQLLLRDAPEHERADRARLVLGECALLVDQPNLAIEPLERYLQAQATGGNEAETEARRTDRARAHLWLGMARLARREYAPAEQNFVKTTELSDGTLAAEAQFRLGESRRQRNDLNGAVDAFVKLPILYADPQWVRAGLLAAGRTYQQLKQPDKAARFFQELVDKHAGSQEAKAAAEQLQQR